MSSRAPASHDGISAGSERRGEGQPTTARIATARVPGNANPAITSTTMNTHITKRVLVGERDLDDRQTTIAPKNRPVAAPGASAARPAPAGTRGEGDEDGVADHRDGAARVAWTRRPRSGPGTPARCAGKSRRLPAAARLRRPLTPSAKSAATVAQARCRTRRRTHVTPGRLDPSACRAGTPGPRRPPGAPIHDRHDQPARARPTPSPPSPTCAACTSQYDGSTWASRARRRRRR